MKLYFARHGESEANIRRIISNRELPLALTPTGREQLTALAWRLAGKPITQIYTSPIPRARETAEILSAALKTPMECVDALREPDCGVLEGRGDEEAWVEHNYWKEAWIEGRDLENGPQDGETCVEVRTRLAGFIRRLIREFGETESELLLVAHGALILFGLPAILEGMDYQTILDHGLDHAVLISTEYQYGKLVCTGWSVR